MSRYPIADTVPRDDTTIVARLAAVTATRPPVERQRHYRTLSYLRQAAITGKRRDDQWARHARARREADVA